MKNFILIIVLSFICNFSIGQENNSNKVENKSINETIKLENELKSLKVHKESLMKNTSENSAELKIISERIFLIENKLIELKLNDLSN